MATMREALEKAFDQDAGETIDSPSSMGSGPESGEVPAQEAEGAIPESPEGGSPVESTDESPEETKGGPKFLPADESPQEEPTQRAPAVERAPVGWKGEAKGHWDALPDSVRQEVLRREKGVSQVLRETASAREFERAFNQTVQPFMGFIQAEQATPLQAFQNLMQNAATLRVGTPQQKATLVSNIIRQYQVDVDLVDNMLVGQQPAQGDPQTNQLFQYLDQRLAPVEALASRFQNAEASAAQRQDAELDAELRELQESGEAQYFEDVKEDMADLLEIAHRRDQKLSYRQAYERAVMMHPELAAAVAQKKAAAERQAQAAAQQASLEKKKRASVSVQGIAPGPNGASPPTSMRDALEQAWEAAEGGGRQ